MERDTEVLRQSKYLFAKHVGTHLYNARYCTQLQAETLSISDLINVSLDYIVHVDEYRNYVRQQLKANATL